MSHISTLGKWMGQRMHLISYVIGKWGDAYIIGSPEHGERKPNEFDAESGREQCYIIHSVDDANEKRINILGHQIYLRSGDNVCLMENPSVPILEFGEVVQFTLPNIVSLNQYQVDGQYGIDMEAMALNPDTQSSIPAETFMNTEGIRWKNAQLRVTTTPDRSTIVQELSCSDTLPYSVDGSRVEYTREYMLYYRPYYRVIVDEVPSEWKRR